MRRALRRWHARHARPLRFRGTTDGWLVLVSEVMAQQTQISRVEAAWATFVDLFPTPAACASATTADVLRAWAGLGYNRRAVQLHRASQAIVELHDGRVPVGRRGPRDAARRRAIHRPCRRGHRIRTAGRRGRHEHPPAWSAASSARPTPPPRALQSDADAMVDPRDPAAWTHAAMDLGASVCVAREPRCGACPLTRVVPHHGPGTRPIQALGTARSCHARRREAPFETTSRWLRGRIVAALRDLDRDEWASPPTAIGGHDAASIAVAVDALVRDGLVERRGDGALRLPGAAGRLPGAADRLPGAAGRPPGAS